MLEAHDNQLQGEWEPGFQACRDDVKRKGVNDARDELIQVVLL